MAGRIGTGKVYAADTTFVYIKRSWATRDGRAMTKGGDRNAGKETPSEREEPGTCRMCQAPAHLQPHVSLCFRPQADGRMKSSVHPCGIERSEQHTTSLSQSECLLDCRKIETPVDC